MPVPTEAPLFFNGRVDGDDLDSQLVNWDMCLVPHDAELMGKNLAVPQD